MAYQRPQTPIEKRAVQFAKDLYRIGYKYQVSTPARELSQELRSANIPICYATIYKYWVLLEKMGYAKKDMQARKLGATYILNYYAIKKQLN